MIFSIFFLCMGLFLLYFGSEWLVDGSSNIAITMQIRPIIIGLTIVAFGTSAPELMVSLLASNSGAEGLSIGNIIGSNVINIALVLGISSIINPITVRYKKIKTELYFLVFTTLFFWTICLDGELDMLNGLSIMLILISFLIYSFLTSSSKNKDNPCSKNHENGSIVKQLVTVSVGTFALCYGAHLVVKHAIHIADFFQISKTFIGLTVVAFGTSLPELATSVIAARKNECDIAIGNIVGSNIFNICLVMGVVSITRTIHVEKGLNYFEFPFTLLLSALLVIFIKQHNKIGKNHGILFCVLFILFFSGSYLLSG